MATLTLKAEVNPGCLSGSGLIDETWCMDNWMEETVSFREAPTLAVGLFSVNYDLGDGTHVDGPSYNQVLNSVKSMKELYPIKSLHISYGPLTSEGGWMPEFGMVGPAFGQVNQELVQRWNWDRWTGAPLFNNPTVRYAGFTTYQNGSLAGLSAGIPGVASTTNVGASAQVFAHELGHNMGRHHTPYCNGRHGLCMGHLPGWIRALPLCEWLHKPGIL